MQLDSWINARHLGSEAQAEYRAAFASVPYSSVVVDDFLRCERLTALQRVFNIEGRFEERYYVWRRTDDGKREEPVAPEVWRAGCEGERASIERVFVGARAEFRLGEGIIAHLKFMELLRSPEWMGFLNSVTGIRPATLTGFSTRVMVGGQYIEPHSDFWMIRDLCGVFYAGGGWQPPFGGRFRHRGPGPEIVPIEPRENRLLLFEPRPDCTHDVEAISEAGKAWERCAFTMWFGTPAAA
ncbi:MAG TPA: 2OG-Fe(II) oxygenase [Stellaceae bacterium]|nr:2OG-Fe(II) oxygenase [Stellaceae bacterium]